MITRILCFVMILGFAIEPRKLSGRQNGFGFSFLPRVETRGYYCFTPPGCSKNYAPARMYHSVRAGLCVNCVFYGCSLIALTILKFNIPVFSAIADERNPVFHAAGFPS